MDVSIKRETAKELISFKLQHIQETIQNLLNKWGEDYVDEFLSKAKKGFLEDADMDAISIHQLIIDYKRLQKLLESIKAE